MKYFFLISALIIAAFSLASCVQSPENEPNNIPDSGNYAAQNPAAYDVSNHPDVIGLKKSLETDPENSDLNFQLGKKYLDLKRPDLARDILAKAVELDSSNVIYKIAYANTFADEGKIAEAEDLFQAIYDNDSENVDVLLSWGVMYYNMALVYGDMERMDKANEKFDQVLKISPDNVKALFNMGLLNLAKRDNENAKKYFLKVHELEPDRLTAINHLANISLILNQWDDCEKYSKLGLEIEANPELVYFLGRVAFEKGDYDKAESHLNDFLSMSYFGQWESDARARLLEIQQMDSAPQSE